MDIKWRDLLARRHIELVRISFVLGLGILSVSVVIYGIARRGDHSEPELRKSAEVVPQSMDGRIDSLRRIRAIVRKRIADSDTYLGHALVEDDSMLRRWQDRTVRMLSVHIGSIGVPKSEATGLEQSVRRAFGRWERVGAIPVTFRFTSDSASAEVHVHWIRSFEVTRSGQADVYWDGEGWIRKAILTLATHDIRGRPASTDLLYTVALHEIGHLLGLGHSDDPADLMHSVTTVSDLTARDRRSARLLYALPAGSVRDP